VVPRPIAWVSTLSTTGPGAVGNLAPHSFFTVASTRPAVVQFTSVGRKDTLRNVEATGEFVVNLASEPLMQLVNQSSAPFGPEVDEAETLGIVLEPSETVAPPRVAASPASVECRLHRTVEVGNCVVVMGLVTAVTVQVDALDGDHPSMPALRPVSRLGRDEWGLPPEVVRLTRPTSG